MKVSIRYNSSSLPDEVYDRVKKVSQFTVGDTGFLTFFKGKNTVLIRANMLNSVLIKGGEPVYE